MAARQQESVPLDQVWSRSPQELDIARSSLREYGYEFPHLSTNVFLQLLRPAVSLLDPAVGACGLAQDPRIEPMFEGRHAVSSVVSTNPTRGLVSHHCASSATLSQQG
jgi:hypothetical protein